MADYVPIACMAHERLEFAVLRRQYLRLSLSSHTAHPVTNALSLTVLPIDVLTRDQAEWLKYRIVGPEGLSGVEQAEIQEVRLDHILRFEVIEPSV
jgi:Rho-binding antiterminator